MRYIKFFESKDLLSADPRWSPFTKEMYKRYCDICMIENIHSDISPADVKEFFKSLEEEYLEADDWRIFEIRRAFRNNSIFYGLVNAHGPFEACLKMALNDEDPYFILEIDPLSIYEIDEEEIDDNISRLEYEIEKWRKIL